MYTNSHIIHTTSFQSAVVSYPDLFCYRTQVTRRNDYLVRLYWQFRQYLPAGIIYFDTLTYDDEHLPHVSDFADFGKDFSCFNPKDVKLFLDRLHSRLNYYKYGTFTHFVCSEYGHDKVYRDHRGRLRKGTKRPHYHILLFFDRFDIDPEWLAQVVHDCWSCGRTDNFGSFRGERSRSYVLRNCFTKQSMSLDRMLRVTHYVSKYVLKDAKFTRKVDKLCRDYCRTRYDHLNDVSKKKAFLHDVNILRRNIGEFIMISNGFGKFFLESENLDLDLIYERSVVCIPDKDKIKRYYPIPEYYLRKLFYTCVDGAWHLNDAGKDYYKYHLRNKSLSYARFLQNCALNMCDDDRVQLYTLLDGRSFQQLADYCVYYRGRICDPRFLTTLPSKDEVVDRLIRVDEDDTPTLMNDPIPKIAYRYALEPRTFWVIDDVDHYSYLAITEVLKRSIEIDDWKQYIIDQSWFPEFYDFDDVLSLIMEYVNKVELSRQELYDEKSYLNEQLTLFGLRTKV